MTERRIVDVKRTTESVSCFVRCKSSDCRREWIEVLCVVINLDLSEIIHFFRVIAWATACRDPHVSVSFTGHLVIVLVQNRVSAHVVADHLIVIATHVVVASHIVVIIRHHHLHSVFKGTRMLHSYSVVFG